MKRLLLPLLFLTITSPLFAQLEMQLHYDFGKTRKCLMSTIQMFDQDRLGSTFFFVDMIYGQDDVDGMNLAYLEIYRTFNFAKNTTFAAHVEYNGGVGTYAVPDGLEGYVVNDAWLGGVEYTWLLGGANFITLQGLFKTIRDKNNASFQLTAIWNVLCLKDKVTLEGFMDFWREDNMYANGEETKYTWLVEPQVWFEVKNGFSIGTEIEMSTNFSGNQGFMINPTLAARYLF